MIAADGEKRKIRAADTEGLLRIIQSMPSPKAEPFKRWLAKVGYERLEEIENPELAAKRMHEIYQQKGYSEDWIEKHMRGIAINAGHEGSVVVDKVKRSKKGIGYDALHNDYVDMVAAGIIDPLKVTRTALENAASIATMILTTEALVCDIPEKDKMGPPMPRMPEY